MQLDVQVTGEVVVYHPKVLEDWTTASGPVSGKTGAEVTALDASVKYQGPAPRECRPADLRIPRLHDVLQRFPNVPRKNCSLTTMQWWTPESVACTTRATNGAKLVFFGINTAAEYAKARALGAYAVFTDAPLDLLK